MGSHVSKCSGPERRQSTATKKSSPKSNRATVKTYDGPERSPRVRELMSKLTLEQKVLFFAVYYLQMYSVSFGCWRECCRVNEARVLT